MTGREKSAVLARLAAGDRALPATHVRPAGELRVFADAGAAADLTQNRSSAARRAG